MDELSLNDSDDLDNEKIINNNSITTYINNNKLSLKGLTRYLKINKMYLSSIKEEENILDFYTNITKGFVFGLKKQRNTLLELEDNRIIGLYNY